MDVGSLVCRLGTSTWSPPKSLAWQKENPAGLWVDLEASWALASGVQPAATCKRAWDSDGGHWRNFMVGCTVAAAAVLSCGVQPDRWVAPHLAVRTLFDCVRWTCRVTQPVHRTPLWPASCLPAVEKSRGSKSVEVQRVWEVHDDRLQFMARHDALLLGESLGADDVSKAWLVWSDAVETALADAYRFAGGPVPTRGLVLGRGSALFRVARLGRQKIRKARSNVADAHDAADVFMYRDSSIAPLLDMRRRFKAVVDVLDSVIRSGASLARSVELTVQWDKIHAVGHLYPVTLEDFRLARICGLGEFHHLIGGVVHRMGMGLYGGGGIGCGRILVHPYECSIPTVCNPLLTPGGSGVLADPARIDEGFRKAWLQWFCRSGQRDASLNEFDREVDGWLPLLPVIFFASVDGTDAC